MAEGIGVGGVLVACSNIKYILLRMLDRQPIRNEIRLLIRQRITIAGLLPGATLNPALIATELGVSQTPVREAMIELVHDGFLDASPNRGFLVRRLTASEAKELYPLMWDLEATALYAAQPPAATLDKLVAINESLTKATEGEVQLSLDSEWHEELVRSCANRTLIEILTVLRWRIRRYEAAYAKHERLPAQPAVQHHAIVLAIRRNDYDRAAQVLELKWQQAMERIVGWLNKAVSGSSDESPL